MVYAHVETSLEMVGPAGGGGHRGLHSESSDVAVAATTVAAATATAADRASLGKRVKTATM